jgi:hypothetical protein
MASDKKIFKPYRLQKVIGITKALLGHVLLLNYAIYCHRILLMSPIFNYKINLTLYFIIINPYPFIT